MAKAVSFMVAFVLLSSLLYADAAGRRHEPLLVTRLQWTPAMLLGDPTESACFPANDTYGMYVALPSDEFRNGKSCNKRIRVSCAEPFLDLGGPWQICRSRRIHTVTVIDRVDEPLDDDLVKLSRVAFSKMAHPDVGMIRLLIHNPVPIPLPMPNVTVENAQTSG